MNEDYPQYPTQDDDEADLRYNPDDLIGDPEDMTSGEEEFFNPDFNLGLEDD